MIDSQKVISFLRIRGPSLPVHISHEINTNVIMASAVLAELVSSHKVKVSHVKIGGSPLYFLPGQEEQLQAYYKYLPDKERRVYELLKEKVVLRDKELTPLERVTIRAIKDYTIPLDVMLEGTEERFWKWYLASDEEAEKRIKELLGVSETKEVADKEGELSQPSIATSGTVTEEKKGEIPSSIKSDVSTEWQKQALGILEKNGVKVEHSAFIKRNEIEFIVIIPTAFGDARYYCIARKKKYINEGDLSVAFLRAQEKKLPLLYLTTGALAKKMESHITKSFPGIIIFSISG
jgi:hypothetical protein